MSEFLIGQKETKMKAIGKRVDVPDYDVCRLSYYLRCGTVSCGIDIIVDELVDFRNAHRLPQDRQDAIFKLAFGDFDLETLGNKTIFLVHDGSQYLQGNLSNEFYEVEQVSNLLAVQREAVIGGRLRQVCKIMICRERWLNKYYVDPLKRNEARLRRIFSQSTAGQQLLTGILGLIEAMELEEDNHCSHCKGLEACQCTCTHGCPRKAQSKCKVIHETVICDGCKTPKIEGPRYKCQQCFNYDLCQNCYRDGKHIMTHGFDKIERIGCEPCPLPPREQPVRTSHCSHCPGSEGKCSCTNGCLAKSNSKCTVVHNATCKECSAQGIQGPRYKCKECWDTDICEKCYKDGRHAMTHGFTRFARVGSQPFLLPPRQELAHPSAPIELFTAKAAAASPTYPVNPTFVEPATAADSSNSSLPIATAVPVTPNSASFQDGQTVRLVGMISDPSQNGREGIVVNRFDGCVVVHLPTEDRKIRVQPQNLEIISPAPSEGTLVELQGLADSTLNGTLAVVTHVEPRNIAPGRVPVKLLDNENRILSVKIENLDIIEQVH